MLDKNVSENKSLVESNNTQKKRCKHMIFEIYSVILNGGLSINSGLGGGFFLDCILFNCAMKA